MKRFGILLIGAIAGTSYAVSLDATAVVTRVLEVSAAVAGADLRTEAAAQAVTAADAALFPSVSATATALHRSSVPAFSIALPGTEPLELMPDIREVYATGVRLDYLLFSGGAVSGTRHAVRQDLEAARLVGVQTRADLSLIATAAYWGAVRASAAVVTAEAQKRRAHRMLSDTEALGNAGMATLAELAAARERVASASVQCIRARALSDNAEATLRSLLHLESTPIQLADSLGGLLPLLPDSLQDLQNRALETCPEVIAAKARRDALKARSSAARAAIWPNLLAVAQWDNDRPNQHYFPPEDEWNDSWSVGLLGTWTVFDGGKARAEAHSLEVAAMAATNDIAELERTVLLEVETTRNDLCSALATVTAADAALEAARERERQVSQRYAVGFASTADVLDALAQLAAAEDLIIQARSSAWVASARLDRAVGR